MKKRTWVGAALIGLALAGCGGGGTDAGTPPFDASGAGSPPFKSDGAGSGSEGLQVGSSILFARVSGLEITVYSKVGQAEVAAPAGTTLTVTHAPAGCSVSVIPSIVPSSAVLPTIHTLTTSGTGCSGQVSVAVRYLNETLTVEVQLP